MMPPYSAETISKRAFAWALAVAAMIFLASTRSQVAGPEGIPGFDKIAHFSIYGLLGTLVVRVIRSARGGRPGRAALVAVLLVSAYGVSDEWHQSFTPGRSVEVADWLADTLGGALAVSLYTWWSWYRRCLEMPLLGGERRIENRGAVATVSPR